MRNGDESFWLTHARSTQPARSALTTSPSHVDVVVIGAGLTGLWTAYWLLDADPGLEVVILEARQVGHGASGRNGGWMSAKSVGLRKHLLAAPGGSPESVHALQQALNRGIGEILEVFEEHRCDIGASRSGFLGVARNAAEGARLRRHVDQEHAFGLTEDDIRYLNSAEVSELLDVPNIHAGYFSSHAAVVDPAKMVLGLARIVEAKGAKIYENSPVTAFSSGTVTTADATITCSHVLNATEGYGTRLSGRRPWIAPIMSSMLVTEPLPPAYWERVGWQQRFGVCGVGHRYFYSQRTSDDRIAMGGRGLPYKFGSGLDRNGEVNAWTVRQLRQLLQEVFDLPNGTSIEHAWCGMLGVPRDWTPDVRFDAHSGVGHAGGFVGQGLVATYLAAGSLADLTRGIESWRTRLPWVDRAVRPWEPEPLRFLGAYGVYGLYQIADSIERRGASGRTSTFAKLADLIGGRT